MLTDYSSADDINESVFRVIKITIGGVSLSIVFLMIANAKRAASLILIKIEEEFSMICQILEEQKTVFRGVQSKDFEGKETFEMVKEIVLDNDLVISWEPPSLDKFNSARMCTLNDKLYAFKSNHQIMSELQGEAENEPELYFKNVSPANLKEIIEATANLSNFVIVSAHALNDCEIKNTAQYEIICLDYETIFVFFVKMAVL
ncbi:hypothetical protein MHBO_003474 [Bonamia ostreae]|uniref:Uncharacterized protein n=1 Tax=Bonamia ostreae TaxID=126728 RepID=A0ABV2AQM0_9EUKA